MPDPADHFAAMADTPISPARTAFAIAPNDTAALPILPKAIFAGTAGAIVLRAVDSAADVTLTVATGQIIPVRPSHVRSTGTTAGGLVGLA